MREVPTHQTRPVWAEVSASQLKENYRAVKKAAGDLIDVLAVVKADAYGHGAVECAPVLAAAGAKWLGVTSVEEGVAVRRALGILPQGVAPRILVMCGLWVGEADACLTHNLTPVVWEPYQLELLALEAKRRGAHSVPVHVEVDTGMSRQGVMPADIDALLRRFENSSLKLEGVMTHLASAEDTAGTQNDAQRTIFEAALQQFAALKADVVHVGNTPSVDGSVVQSWLPGAAHKLGARAMTRAGLALYGYTLPLTAGGHAVETAPTLTWKTRVVSLREIEAGTSVGYSATFTAPRKMKLALLPVGYADGLRRELSSRGSVLIRGQRAPIVGRVSMDLTMVDVSSIDGVSIGDEAVLLGSQGDARIGVEEHAEIAQTIPYEILCAISDRVPRLLVE